MNEPSLEFELALRTEIARLRAELDEAKRKAEGFRQSGIDQWGEFRVRIEKLEAELTAARADAQSQRERADRLEQDNALLIAGSPPNYLPIITTTGALPEDADRDRLRERCERYERALRAIAPFAVVDTHRGPDSDEWNDAQALLQRALSAEQT